MYIPAGAATIMRKLSVGYIVDDGRQPGAIHDVIEKSKSAENYSIDYLIVQTFADEDENLLKRIYRIVKERGFFTPVARALLKAIFALEVRLFVRDPRLKSAFDLYGLDTFHVPKIHVRPVKAASGRGYRYRDDDLEKIKSLGIDVLLNGQNGVFGGGILDVCEFGIVSLDHRDNETAGEGLPAFWEVFNREPSTRFAIQRLLGESGSGGVLMRGSIPTAPTYAQNLARISKKSTVFVHRLLENLATAGASTEGLLESSHTDNPCKNPSLRVLAAYQIKTLNIAAQRVFNILSRKDYRWGVGYQYAQRWQDPALAKSILIANPPHRFLADPFVFRRGNLEVCFVEDYDYRTKRGKISVFQISGDEHWELGTVLDEPFHLSYPFIFEVDNELYMCPETGEIGEIRLYKCIEFPLRWSYHKTLMRDVAAVDTNIFFLQDKWWLLTTFDSSEIGDVCSELHAFYSDSFDSDAWTPHAKNPVVFDSERARCGGFFRDGEKLLRVFQRQGFGSLYGESMGIARINHLDPETYDEETVSIMEPDFVPSIVGTHTFSYCDGLLAIDYLKIEQVKA